MSLVSEALRKARQEAAAGDARRRGVVFRTTVVLPPRRSRLVGGPLLGIVIVVAAALAGAAGAWWALGRRHGGTVAPVEAVPVTAGPAAGGAGFEAPATVARAVIPHKPEPGRAALVPPAHANPAPSDGETTLHTDALAPPLPPPVHAQPAGATAAPASGTPSTAGSGHAEPNAESDRFATQGEPTEHETRERTFVVNADLGYAKLSLDYIAYKPSAPFAGVNGHQVRIGTVVDGFTVDEIAEDFVKLHNRRGTFVLRTH